jgi:putative hemolysin
LESDPANIGLEIILILILILANGLFAMSEIAIVSSRKARLERLADEGGAGARAALQLAKDPTQFLSAVQVGITLIGIGTGAYGGATIAKPFAAFLKTLPGLAPYADSVSMTVVVAAITFLSLIVGELVPKKIALNNPESLAVIIAVPMRLFAKVAAPVVRLLSASTEIILRLIGVKKPDEPPVTEEEIKIMIAEGAEYGTFEPAEKDLVDRVFRFGDMRVSAFVTPRTQIDWLDLEEDDAHNLGILTESGHSWLPVARGSLDEIAGIVKTRNVLAHRLSGERLQLESHIQEPLMVPRSMRAFRLLELFQQSGKHVAVVIDEFGGMTGLVTIHDIFEQLVGEMPQQDEDDIQPIVRREDGSWLIDGLLPIEDFKQHFDLDELPGEDKEHYQTLGGFITSYLGDIPQPADIVEWNGLRLEVLDMDRARVDKVLVTAVPADQNSDRDF